MKRPPSALQLLESAKAADGEISADADRHSASLSKDIAVLNGHLRLLADAMDAYQKAALRAADGLTVRGRATAAAWVGWREVISSSSSSSSCAA